MIAFLSKIQILHIHQRHIDRFGGTTGVRDDSALESAVTRPQATFGGEDLYVSVAEKAAALLHSLASNHPFIDGNKRTAALSAELFLLINGFELSSSDRDLEELVMSVARGDHESEEIAIGLEQRLIPLR